MKNKQDIDRIVEAVEKQQHTYRWRDRCLYSISAIRTALEGLDLDGEGVWISINDDLPKHGEWVLASNKFGKMFCVWFSAESNRFIDGVDSFDKNHSYQITHWQPLPQPPTI